MYGEAWQATVHGVAKSRTRLSNFTSLSIPPYRKPQIYFLANPVYMYHIFTHSPVDGNVCCFHVLAIVNSAAV